MLIFYFFKFYKYNFNFFFIFFFFIMKKEKKKIDLLQPINILIKNNILKIRKIRK